MRPTAEWRRQRKELVGLKRKHEEAAIRDFLGGPVAKTLSFQCRGPGSVPGQGARSLMPYEDPAQPNI